MTCDNFTAFCCVQLLLAVVGNTEQKKWSIASIVSLVCLYNVHFTCACDNCQILQRTEECKCCSQYAEIIAKNLEAVKLGDCDEPSICITLHPGFQALCLKWVLQAAWFQYKQQYHKSYDGPEHKLKRHIAYRHLVRWCWGVIGKEIRVPLPSCAVCGIRAHFPPPGLEDDFIIEGFHFPDEWKQVILLTML